MPEDTHTRIIISIENGDAVQKCKELEVGLENVTEARKADVDAAHSATQAATQNAQAMEREAAAVNKTAHAIKKVNWDALAKERREFAKFIREEEKKEAERNITPEREAATKELRERKRVMREVQQEQKRMSKMSNAFLDEEIKDQRVLVAEKRKQLAIEKEIILQRKLNDIRDRLNDAAVRRDPEKFRDALNLRDKYEYQSMLNTREIFDAEKNLRKANGSLKGLNETAGKSGTIFQRATRGIGRSLSAIARIGGKGLGMGMSTEGLTGPGAHFIAASVTVGAVATLIRSIQTFREGERTGEYEMRMRNLRDMEQLRTEMQAETQKRQEGIKTLLEYSNLEKMTNVTRLKQKNILSELNYSLEGMQVDVDKTSGRIRNMGEVAWQVKKRDVNREIQGSERILRSIDREIEIQKKLGEPGVISSAITSQLLFMAGPHGIPFMFGGSVFNKIQKKINDSIDLTFNRSAALERDRRLQDAQDRRLEESRRLGELRKSINNDEEIKFFQLQNAELEDSLAKLREKSAEVTRGTIKNEWQFRHAQALKYNWDELKRLRNETSDIVFARISSLREDQSVEGIRAYNKALSELNEKMIQRQQLEVEWAKQKEFNLNVKDQLQNMRNEVGLQKLINEGKKDEAEIERIRLGILQKINNEGWSPEQAKEWGRLQAMQYDISTKSQRDSIAGAGVQFRDTSVASVNANSLEALRLQSRMLVRNTPQTQLLNYTQKQTKMLEYIENKMRQWLPGKDLTQIKTATV